MAYYVDYKLETLEGEWLEVGRLGSGMNKILSENLRLVILEIGNDGFCCRFLRHAVNNHELNIGRRKFLDVDIDYCPWRGTSLDEVRI